MAEQELVSLPASTAATGALPAAALAPSSGALDGDQKAEVKYGATVVAPVRSAGILELDFDSPEALAASGAVFCDSESEVQGGLRVSVVGEYEFVRVPRGGHLVLGPDAYVRIDGVLSALQASGPLKDYSIVIDCGVHRPFATRILLLVRSSLR